MAGMGSIYSFSMSAPQPPTLDSQAAHRWASRRIESSPWLHNEVARRMVERLQWVIQKPERWIHWEPLRSGLCAQDLIAQAYPKASCLVRVAHPESLSYLQQLWRAPWWHPKRWIASWSSSVTLAYGKQPPHDWAQMLWANMSLHLVADPAALIRDWHSALSEDGFLMFSCLGPDTLRELRQLYQDLGWPAPAHEFTDMHDWGDMLVQAGFAEPVMDMERIELTFETPERLLQELRELGRNFHIKRFGSLRGRRWLRQLHDALGQQLRRSGEETESGLRLTFEIVYGHAFKPTPKIRMSQKTEVPMQDLKSMLRRNKPASPKP